MDILNVLDNYNKEVESLYKMILVTIIARSDSYYITDAELKDNAYIEYYNKYNNLDIVELEDTIRSIIINNSNISKVMCLQYGEVLATFNCANADSKNDPTQTIYTINIKERACEIATNFINNIMNSLLKSNTLNIDE